MHEYYPTYCCHTTVLLHYMNSLILLFSPEDTLRDRVPLEQPPLLYTTPVPCSISLAVPVALVALVELSGTGSVILDVYWPDVCTLKHRVPAAFKPTCSI
eukprot:8849-Heterococcus_DN1.PRE.1